MVRQLALLPWVFHVWASLVAPVSAGLDGFYAACGGEWVAVKSRPQAVCQGHASGRWSLIFRTLATTLAGTLMSLVRIVPVLALANKPSTRTPAARVRL